MTEEDYNLIQEVGKMAVPPDMEGEARKHLKGIRIALVREELGGVKAVESDLYEQSIMGLYMIKKKIEAGKN